MTVTKACCDESDALSTAGRSVAQSGSAPGLGPGGRRFESYRSDHFQIVRCQIGLVFLPNRFEFG